MPDIVPLELRKQILNEYEDCADWKPGLVMTDVDSTPYRDVSLICLSTEQTIQKNQFIRASIDTQLFKCAEKVTKAYADKNPLVTFTKDSGYDLLRYKERQFYVEHVDDANEEPRTLSCSFALNDDYEGGEWSFFGGAYTTRLNAGDAILFPSNFLFPHSIRPVLSGVRYSVVTWFR